MHKPTVTTHEFINHLQPHLDKTIAFEYNGRRIQPGYHVTEIKAASYKSLDCGARPQQWNETIFQLWDVAEEAERGHMPIKKFLGIYNKVNKDVGLDSQAEIKFEWGDAETPAVFYTLDRLVFGLETVIAYLEPVRATCKPRDDGWLTQQGDMACCTPTAPVAAAFIGLESLFAPVAATPQTNACCTTEKQAVCCEPSDKAECCGVVADGSGSCGCQ